MTNLDDAVGRGLARMYELVEQREREEAERERALANRPPEEIEAERKREEAKAERERLKALESRKDSLRRRGVPAKDIGRIVDGGVTETVAIAEARAFLDDESARMLILSGPRGCGKTMAASWLASREVVKVTRWPDGDREWTRDIDSRFVDVSRLSRVSRYSDEQMEPLERCELLVIDDLGMEYADEKGSFLATLDGLVNARYAADLRTIITTNLPAAEFKRRYGERIADRIRECGKFVELSGESMRKGQRQLRLDEPERQRR